MTASPPVAAVRIERLKKRPDFLRAAQAQALSRGAVFVQLRARQDDDALIRAGFTATKKIGGSVERNRAKRRLREAARLLLPLHGKPSCDYVFIARGGTRTRAWARLLDDVKTALISLAAELDRAAPVTSPGSSPDPSGAADAPDPSVSG